jgi:predicted DNA-binding transcriptional regulator YafY
MALRPIPRPKVVRVGRPAGKFTQHRRLDFLRDKLEAHAHGLTLEEIAGMLRVSTRSVRRYLRELAVVTELESVPEERGIFRWRVKPSERGRTVALRRTQAYALLATRRVFEVLKGSALYDEIDVALRQIEQVAQRPAVRTAVRGDASSEVHLEERFAYVPPALHHYGARSEDVDELFQAVAELRVLRFRYRDPMADGAHEARPARVTAHPYALVLHAGAIVCVGKDADAGASRAFAFDGMAELAASEAERFDLPADFDLGPWLHGEFGVARAPRTVKLLVEFDPRVAEQVRARKVHPTQKVAVAADGRVRVSLSVPEARDVLSRVQRWLLGFGSAAHVLEPPDLADAVARELERTLARYPRNAR